MSSDTARIEALEAALADVRKRLDPQTLAQALERTWSPRGGEPRIVDEDGRTLDYTPFIQFLNATTELDVPAQRVVVTPTGGGGGGATYRFSDDLTLAADEKIVFEAESGPATPHMFIGGVTIGTTRAGIVGVAEDMSDPVLAPDTPSTSVAMIADATAGTSNGTFGAAGPTGGTDGAVNVDGSATTGGASLSAGSTFGAPNNLARVRVSATDVVGPQVHVDAIASATGQGPPDIDVLARAFDTNATASIGTLRDDTGSSSSVELAPGTAEVSADAETRTLLDSGGASGFVQLAGATVVRHLRGPFTATPGAGIGPLGTGAVAVNSALFGAAQAVVGAISSAAGDEVCVWSWQAGPGANQVTISFTNVLAAGPALLPTLTFHTICDA